MRKVIRQSCGRRPRCGVPLLGAALVCAALGAGVSSAVADTLGGLRAERRAALQQRPAGTIRPPGPSGHLDQGLVGALPGPGITTGQAQIGIDPAH